MIGLPLEEFPPIEMPELDWVLLGPMAVVMGAAAIGVLIEAFMPRDARRPVQLTLTFASLIVAFVLVVLAAGSRVPQSSTVRRCSYRAAFCWWRCWRR